MLNADNIVGRWSVVEGPAYRKEMRRWIVEFGPDYMLTLAFNGPTYFQSGADALRGFHARLDRELLGPRWARKTIQRTQFLAFPEHSLSNFHYHLAVRVRRENPPSGSSLEKQMERIWRSLVPSGSVKLDPVTSQIGLARYLTKEILIHDHHEHFIISTEFGRD